MYNKNIGGRIMAYQKIEYKCEKCGCNEVEIIPTKYGTAAMCTKCMNNIK